MAAKAEAIEESVTCSICLSVFTKPKALPCLHTYCESCLQDHVNKTQKNGVFSCPLCNAVTTVPTDGVSGFQDNFHFNAVIENLGRLPKKDDLCNVCLLDGSKTKAEKFCIDCSDPLCVPCSVGHTKSRFTRGHHIVSMSDVMTGMYTSEIRTRQLSYCKEHPQEQVKAFCEDCGVPICMLCKAFKHDSHIALSIADGVKLTAAEFGSYMTPQRECLEFTKRCIDEIQTAENLCVKEVNRISGLISEEFEKHRQAVSEKETELLTKVQNSGKSIREHLRTSLQKAQSQLDITSGCVSALQRFDETKSDIEKLTMYKKVKDELLLKRPSTSVDVEEPVFEVTGDLQLPQLDLKLDSKMTNKSFVMPTGNLVNQLMLNNLHDQNYFTKVRFINDMFIATRQNQALVFNRDGQHQHLLDHLSGFKLKNAIDITSNDRDGTIYVLDHNVNGIAVFDKTFNFLKVIKKVPFQKYSTLTCVANRLIMNSPTESSVLILSLDDESERFLDYSKAGVAKGASIKFAIASSRSIIVAELKLTCTQPDEFGYSAKEEETTCVHILNSTGRRILHSYSPKGALALKDIRGLCCDNMGHVIVLDCTRVNRNYDETLRLHVITLTGERVSLMESKEVGQNVHNQNASPVDIAVTGHGEVSVLHNDGSLKVFQYLEK